MGSLANIKTILATAVANAGTVIVPYPAGTTQAMLTGTTGGSVAISANDVYKQAGSGAGTVAFTFGLIGTGITITNNSGVAWPAGAELIASFGRTDINGSYNLTSPKQLQDKVNAI